MAQVKRIAEAEEDLRNLMEDVLVRAGAASYCPHGTFLTRGDSEAETKAYKIASAMHRDGELSGSLNQVREAVKAAIENAAEECSACRKWQDE
jgi:hypothetical protein